MQIHGESTTFLRGRHTISQRLSATAALIGRRITEYFLRHHLVTPAVVTMGQGRGWQIDWTRPQTVSLVCESRGWQVHVGSVTMAVTVTAAELRALHLLQHRLSDVMAEASRVLAFQRLHLLFKAKESVSLSLLLMLYLVLFLLLFLVILLFL